MTQIEHNLVVISKAVSACEHIKGTFKYYVIICDLKNLVPFGHKELWRPLAANRGSCDFKDVVAFGHNQLWRPPVAKFRL